MRVILSANIGRGVTGPADVRVGYAIVDQSGRRLGGAIDPRAARSRGARGADASWSYVNSVILRPGSYAHPARRGDAGRADGQRRVQLDARLAAR